MAKYLRKFETTADYESARQNLILPNVSYIVEGNTVGYNPWVETKLVVYYDIQDISSPTTIFTNNDNSVKSIEVDGVLLDSVVTTYQFDSVGEHIIKYEFNNPTTVGNGAPLFYNLATIKRAVIADTFTSIGNNAFNGSNGLTSVTIGSGVTSIGSSAFRECTSLTSCTIGNSVTSISYGAFASCSSLASITSLATTAPTIQNNTFQNVKTDGTLTVPSGSSGYDVWMGTGNYYLGKYNWSKVEQ